MNSFREVLVELGRADVLEHADRADRVEGAVDDVAVVLHPDLDPIGETGLANRVARPLRLSRRERHADGVHTVLAGRVHHHAAPAAPDVEQTHGRAGARACGTRARTWPPAPPPTSCRRARTPRTNTSSTVRGRAGRSRSTRRSGARSRPRRAPCCAGARAPAPLRAAAGSGLRPSTPASAREREPLPGRHLHVGQVVAERERLEDVALDFDLTGDVRAGEADLAGSGEHIAQRLRRADDDAGSTSRGGPRWLPS